MPCYDGGPSCDSSSEDLAEIQHLKARNDKLAQMLCCLCGILEESSPSLMHSIQRNRSLRAILRENEDIYDWWLKHKEFDAKRLAEEKIKRQTAEQKRNALRKLSVHERNLLGLPGDIE